MLLAKNTNDREPTVSDGPSERSGPPRTRPATASTSRQYLRTEAPLAPDTLVEALRGYAAVQVGAVYTETETFFDTFDSRIYSAGWTLTVFSDGEEPALRLRTFDGQTVHEDECEEHPAFVGDLPPGPVRDKLASLVAMRRMLPGPTSDRTVLPLRILDKERKTVVRLFIEREGASRRLRGEQPTQLLVRVVAVRGYSKRFNAVQRCLTETVGLCFVEQAELVEMAIPTPANPARGKKLRVPLSGEMTTLQAMKTIYLTLLDTIEDNVDGTVRDLDSEFLHDLRVAVRRTRAALSQVKDVFPAITTQRIKAEFRWLGQATGPTRDLDVYLLKYDSLIAGLPKAERIALEPLRAHIQARQRFEQARLAEALTSPRFASLMRTWRALLEKPAPKRTVLANALRPIDEVGAERIRKSYRSVIRSGTAIHPDTSAESVHDLRLLCKKLRYMMELTGGLFDEAAIGKRIKELKKLQENLGDFNDYEVQQATLRQFARDMAADGAPVESLMAMGRLVSQLEEQQARVRSKVESRFAAFATDKNRALFRELFTPSPSPANNGVLT